MIVGLPVSSESIACEDGNMTVVRRESAYQQALEWLRGQIAHGAWQVGDRIPTEPELTALLGVGRNTVREVIKTLTSTGILEIRRGSGTYVRARTDIGGLLGRQVGVSEMLNVYEVRRALETEAVRLACRRRTEEDLSTLTALLRDREHTADHAAEFADADLAFHLALVAAAHNPVLSDLFAGILEPMRATYDFTEGVHEPSLTTDHHRGVVAAIAAREEEAAVRAALGYLDRVLDAVRQRSAATSGS